MNKTITMLKETKYKDLLNNPSLLEFYIQDLTPKELMNMSTTLNQLLRNKKNEEVIADNMMVGELVAPISRIRNEILGSLIETIKLMDNVKLRAELIYYTFIKLHMFSDGNGRTSRLLYAIFTGIIDEDEWYIHNDNEMHKYDGDFCTYKGMSNESVMNHQSAKVLSSIVNKYALIYPNLLNKQMFRTFFHGVHGVPININNLITQNVADELTEEEKNDICIILSDNEGTLSIAGLTMLVITANNGQLDEWIKRDEENTDKVLISSPDMQWIRNRLSFNLKKNGDLLHDWEIEDWKNVISIGCQLKCLQFKGLNDLYLEKSNNKQMNI